MSFDLALARLLQKKRRDDYLTHARPGKPHCSECFCPTAPGETICKQCAQIKNHESRAPERAR